MVSSCRLLKSGHDQVMVFLKISENVILCGRYSQSQQTKAEPEWAPSAAALSPKK